MANCGGIVSSLERRIPLGLVSLRRNRLGFLSLTLSFASLAFSDAIRVWGVAGGGWWKTLSILKGDSFINSLCFALVLGQGRFTYIPQALVWSSRGRRSRFQIRTKSGRSRNHGPGMGKMNGKVPRRASILIPFKPRLSSHCSCPTLQPPLANLHHRSRPPDFCILWAMKTSLSSV